MQRIIIFGNSGSGKTTLARKLSEQYALAHLDLDSLAWLDIQPPSRRPIAESAVDIDRFVSDNPNWVIEGCYADLLRLLVNKAEEVIFLNPGIEACIANSRKRPWEPHKYSSPEAQNRNLEMLIAWIRDYENRNDEFSLSAHRELFNTFQGNKKEIV